MMLLGSQRWTVPPSLVLYPEDGDISFLETLVLIYPATLCQITEDTSLHTHLCEISQRNTVTEELGFHFQQEHCSSRRPD
jgi:hypothetical protein